MFDNDCSTASLVSQSFPRFSPISSNSIDVNDEGLSSLHISPSVLKKRPSLDYVDGYGLFESEPAEAEFYVYSEAYAEVVVDAALVRVKRARHKVISNPEGDKLLRFCIGEDEDGEKRYEYRVVKGGSGRATRGNAQFSSASQRRLRETVARVNRDYKPLFVTLTYPDEFSKDSVKWKRDLDTFGKRFLRRYENGSSIWRMEVVPRRTGENEGQLAPHFHLLVWGADYASLKHWIGRAWYEVVGSGDEKHLRAGTSVEYIRSWNGVNHYVSKYMSKVVLDQAGDCGRWWGVLGRDKIPWGTVLKIWLTSNQANSAIRLGRKLIGLTGKTLYYGLTWMMNGQTFLDYLEFLESG